MPSFGSLRGAADAAFADHGRPSVTTAAGFLEADHQQDVLHRAIAQQRAGRGSLIDSLQVCPTAGELCTGVHQVMDGAGVEQHGDRFLTRL